MMKNIIILGLIFMTQTAWAVCFDENNSMEQNFDNCKIEAEKGNADAQYELANMYNNSLNSMADEKQAAVWYRKAAEQDHDLAQYSLGVMYEFGLGGLEQNEQSAQKWYRLAADNGNYFAQNKLGMIVQKEGKHETSITPYYDDSDEQLQQHPDNRNAIERLVDWVKEKVN